MHISSFYGDYLLIQYYKNTLKGDASIEDKKGKQVLSYAKNDIVRRSLIDLKDASLQGDKQKFDLLLKTGSKINKKSTIFSITPIHNAVQNAY
jgi:hypothetical protein